MGRHSQSGASVDSLRAALREEAARHEPDRVAILARVEAGREVRRAPKRLGLVTSAVAAACGIAVVAGGIWMTVVRTPTASEVGSVGPAETTSQVGVATSTPAPPSTSPRRTAPGGPQAPRHSASPSPIRTSATPQGTRPVQGFLWSDGSVDPRSSNTWAQSNITLKNRWTMTALQVKVRIALTPGVASTGTWSTVPNGDITVKVTKQDDALLYEFVLKPGATLAPGTYTFAAQYSHAGGGRDAGRDTYEATATGHGSDVQVYGNFY
jgi:hypothetical protein